MTADVLGYACSVNGFLHCPLHQALVHVMPPLFSRPDIPPAVGPRGYPLPAPVGRRGGVFVVQSLGQSNTAPPVGQIPFVSGFDQTQVVSQPRPSPQGGAVGESRRSAAPTAGRPAPSEHCSVARAGRRASEPGVGAGGPWFPHYRVGGRKGAGLWAETGQGSWISAPWQSRDRESLSQVSIPGTEALAPPAVHLYH